MTKHLRGTQRDHVKYLLIIGAGGHGKVVVDVAESLGDYDDIFLSMRDFPRWKDITDIESLAMTNPLMIG